LALGRETTPETFRSWKDIPAVPQQLFKRTRLFSHPAAQPAVIYETSGTTTGRPGRHYLLDAGVYRVVSVEGARRVGLFDGNPELFFLTPPPGEAPHSSLSAMFGFWRKALRRTGSPFQVRKGTFDSAAFRETLKAAIKDVGRAMEIPYGEVDRLAKMVPNQLNIKLKDALEQAPQLRQAIQADEKIKELFTIAQRLEGLSRHASTHAAGVVISPRPLTELVPVYKTNRDEITTQYDMKALDRLGLLKMDFLGLTTLTVVNDAVKLIEQHRGEHVDLDLLPLGDAETFKLFARGDTTAIFQFESHGMRDILRRYQPSRIEDLTALNALYRPGPIQGGMIDDFIARKHGKKKVAYDLPELKEILEETYGVILYQEQVMQIANRLAGFSLGEADILRRAMGKKKKEEMAAQRDKFLAGASTRKVSTKKAEHVFDLMAEFAGYGFNKSHSCAYALLAYQTAWLKTHYPVEFMAALLTSETGNTEKVVKYINEARGMSITVLPPDVNSSDLYFTPANGAIRFGLAAIKNVGEGAARAMIAARTKSGNFTSIFSFCENVDPKVLNKRALESLIKSGAMDSIGPRERLIATLDEAIVSAQKLGYQRAVGQSGLFGGAPAPVMHASHELRDAEPWPEHERLAGEYATLGFYVSGHPLERYADRLRELRVLELGAIDENNAGEDVAIAGIVVAVRPMRSKKGARWAIFTLQDMSGVLEVLAFPESFARMEGTLKSGAMLVVRGRVNVEDAGTRIVAADARAIEDIAEAPPSLVRVRLDLGSVNEELLDRLKDVFRTKPGGCGVAFDFFSVDGTLAATLDSKQYIRPDRALVQSVRDLCGPDSVELIRDGSAGTSSGAKR